MATYTVKTPDGKTVTMQGPDGASENDVIAQAQQLYKPQPVDDSRLPQVEQPISSPTAQPNPAQTPTDIVVGGRYPGMNEGGYGDFIKAKYVTDAQGKILGPPGTPAPTKDQQIQSSAEQRSQQNVAQSGNYLTALKGGLTNSTMGIAPVIAAGVERGDRLLTGGALTGNTTDASFGDILKLVQANQNADADKSLAGNLTGNVLGGAAMLGGAGKALGAIGEGLAGSAAPIAAKAGNVLQELTSLNAGDTAANAGKLLLGAGAAGGLQANAEGKDPLEGAAYGVLGGAVGGLGAKAIGGLAKTAQRFSGDIPTALKTMISENPDALAARAADLSQRTGTDVPLIAALNDRDFSKVADHVVQRSGDATDIAKNQSTKYVRNFMDRMLTHVNKAGDDSTVNNAAWDTSPKSTTIGDLAQLQKDTADSLMKPIENKTLDITQLPLDDLERAMTRQIGGRIQGLAPRINKALSDLSPDDMSEAGVDASDLANARRIMSQYGFGTPVNASVRELDGLRRSLSAASKASVNSNPANSMAFKNASNIVQNFVSKEVPEYGQMVKTYAAQSRMMEGFKTAADGTRVTDVADNQLRSNLQSVEGRVGMRAGELYRLRQAATAKPTSAIALARDLGSGGQLTRPASMDPGAAMPGSVTENIGDKSAANLADSSRAETTVLDRMLDTDKINALAKNEGGALSVENLVHGALLGHALPTTKLRFILNLAQNAKYGIPQETATKIADMLYSTDPSQTQTALRALQRAGLDSGKVAALMPSVGQASAGGAMSGGGVISPTPEAQQPAYVPLAPQDDPFATLPGADSPHGAFQQQENPFATLPGADPKPETNPETNPGTDGHLPYGHAVVSSLFPGAQITSDVRGPNDPLSEKNPGSYHTKSQNAVDVRPIKDMTFSQFIEQIHAAGYSIIEARDEVNHPIHGLTTGPHWHVVIG